MQDYFLNLNKIHSSRNLGLQFLQCKCSNTEKLNFKVQLSLKLMEMQRKLLKPFI